MSDAASIALRTYAIVVGAPVTTEKSKPGRAGQPDPHRDRRAQEKLFFDGFTVEPVLGLHGQPDKHVTEVMEGAINSLAPKLTPSSRPRKRRSRIAAPSIRASSPKAPSPI